MALVTLLAAVGLAAAQDGCTDRAPLPPAVQVAWVSPVRKRVRAGTSLSVVRVAELRSWIQQEDADPVRVLQHLGLVGRKGPGWFTPRRWKVTIFDVRTDALCRPVEFALEGELVDGLPACARGGETGIRFSTGCGTTLDTVVGDDGPDRYQVPWRDAATNGFCVMPLERFVAGA